MLRWLIVSLVGVGVWTSPQQHLDRGYQFSYAVASPENLNYHGHRETRDSYGFTSGSYYHLGPDGLWHHTLYFDDGTTGIKKIYTKLPPHSPPPEFTGVSHQWTHSSSPSSFNLLQPYTKTSFQVVPTSTPSLSNQLSLSFKKSPHVFPSNIGFTAQAPVKNNNFQRTPLLISQQNQNAQLTERISPVTSSRNTLIAQRTSFPHNTISNLGVPDRTETRFVDATSPLISQLTFRERTPIEIIRNAHRTFSKPTSNTHVATPKILFFSQEISGLSSFPTNANANNKLFQGGHQSSKQSFNPETSIGSSIFIEEPIIQQQIQLLLNNDGNASPSLVQLPLVNSFKFDSNTNLPTAHSDK